jgi:phosphoribosylamine---glycine ligase
MEFPFFKTITPSFNKLKTIHFKLNSKPYFCSPIMKILLLGSGGREHALAWKISESDYCKKLYIAPGNPGTSQCGENVNISVNDFHLIKKFVLEKKIEMVVVGPEDPLVNGIYDFFMNDKSLKKIPVIGPSKAGAQLEGSKAFAKKFMVKHKIPTAKFKSFNANEIDEALKYIEQHEMPVVLKADGLAAGKGVVICENTDDAKGEIHSMLADKKFGEASSKVVIEQFLKGVEFSVFILTDGKKYNLLPTAKDYKRVGENDSGLNTGGMGAVSPVPFVDKSLIKKVKEKIIDPTLKGLRKDKIVYKGFIYFGLIRVNNEPIVIEYNCRLGDPETEAVLPLIKTDLVKLFKAVAKGKVRSEKLKVKKDTAVTIVLTSGGYPGLFEKNKIISGLDKVKGSFIFHAGTKKENETILTNGGRVLAITSTAKNIAEAKKRSIKNAERIQFENKYFRHDIGFEFLNQIKSKVKSKKIKK